LHIPSFENGYAPRDGEPLYPNLFKGLIGAWCPSLGITGGTLRDLSGRGNHGTLTNMDPSTDWVVSDGQYALDFDGSNDSITAGTTGFIGLSQVTIATWVRLTSTADEMLFNARPTNSILNFFVFVNQINLRGGSATSITVAAPTGITNNWRHLAATIKGTEGVIYYDGVSIASGTVAAIGSAPTGLDIGAFSDFGGGYYFSGQMAEITAWNRALTVSEVRQLYQLGRGGMYALRLPKKYWNFKYESQKPRKSQQIIIKHDSPSFENGFAPRDGEALYPNLLKGLVGAWCPSLGVTGGILRDVSGRNNHGTLTNMDPATDWVIDGGKGALDFDGVNDYINCGKPDLSTGNYTCVAWIKVNPVGGSIQIASNWTGGSSGCHFASVVNGKLYGFAGIEIYNASDDLRDGKWHLVSVRRVGNFGLFNVDGKETFGSTIGSNDAGASPLNIGSRADAVSQTFSGQIAEVLLWNRALSPNEIRQLYQLGRGGLFALKSRRITTTIPARIPNSRSSLISRPPIEASYENGFAPRDGEPLYPNLFKGLIGAWCPSMGVTGNILRDLSGRNNHGVLTNMDPATDWVIDGGQYAMDFDGVNDRINVGNITIPARKTISCWIKRTGTETAVLFSVGQSTTPAGYFIAFVGNDIYNRNDAVFYGLAFGGLTAGQWRFLCIASDGSNYEVYVDAIFKGTMQDAGASLLRDIGAYDSNNFPFSGRLDDIVIWNRTLSANEIRQLYQLGRGGMFRFKPQTARKTISLPATWLKVGEEWTETQPKIATGSKASLITRSPIEPSYENGFAPRDGEPLYPNLFKGLVGAWCPSMGVTGNTLRDLSGRNNHGTLTNMDPATDWVVSDGQYALDFDGANDWVDVGASTILRLENTSWSIAFWAKPALRSMYQAFVAHDSNATQNPLYEFGIANNNKFYFFNGSVISLGDSMTSNWQFCVAVGAMTSASVFALYLTQNAVITATQANIPVFGQARGQRLRFGVDAESGSGQQGFLQGQMDNITMWNRALALSEIRQLYQLGRGGMFTLKPKTIALPTSTIWQPSQSRLYTGEWK